MHDTDDTPRRNAAACLQAAARLEQPLGALAEAMDDIDRVATQSAHSTYMAQVVDERARYQQLESMTQPESTLAATLADRDATARLLHLLAPSLVFPDATPMQFDLSGKTLHRARQVAELHKENLRKLIAAEVARIDAADSVP